MDFLKETITEWLKELLVGWISSNLSGMFDSVNGQVRQTPGGADTTGVECRYFQYDSKPVGDGYGAHCGSDSGVCHDAGTDSVISTMSISGCFLNGF